MLTLEDFRQQFADEVKRRGITWEVRGFLGVDKRVYCIGTDTKVISTVFEALAGPVILQLAEANGYEVSFAKQTVYPDFTLTPKGQENNRIAIDIKTTYQKSPDSPIVFTLGSYTSFLRNGTKNIRFPYAQYRVHWIIGFVYVRVEGIESKMYASSEQASEVVCPYTDVKYFVQEKYKIAGLKPGSGNTANMGSFQTSDIEDLRHGRGPFAKHGKHVFEDYWRNYARDGSTKCSSVEEFLNTKKPAS
jgi:hypothetical protein